jgi:ABC-type multidrug transport system permease subunit
MIETSMLLSLLVKLVIVGLIFWLIWWFIDWVGVPEPFHKVLKVVIGLIVLVYLISLLLGLSGTPLFR